MLAQASSIGSAPARDVPQPPDGWVCPVFEGTSFLPCEGSAQAKERRVEVGDQQLHAADRLWCILCLLPHAVLLCYLIFLF